MQSEEEIIYTLLTRIIYTLLTRCQVVSTCNFPLHQKCPGSILIQFLCWHFSLVKPLQAIFQSFMATFLPNDVLFGFFFPFPFKCLVLTSPVPPVLTVCCTV